MSKFAKIALSMAFLTVISLASNVCQVAQAAKPDSVTCTIDIVNTIHNSSGAVVSTEAYQREFVLVEGVPYSEDYSTRTRFKFFDAALTRNNGESVVAMSWYADVSVFNAVDLTTAVKLSNGQKSNESSASHTYYFSGGFNRTTYTLVGVRE